MFIFNFLGMLVVFNKTIFQIVLHNHNEEPNVMDSGYLVPPGATTHMPIERKEVQSYSQSFCLRHSRDLHTFKNIHLLYILPYSLRNSINNIFSSSFFNAKPNH